MLRLVRFGIVCSVVSSVALVAVAFLAWSDEERRTPTTPTDLLQIDPPQRSLGDIKAGSVTLVPFTVSNSSSHPIRVLGVQRLCSHWGCIRQVGLPVTVPPRSSHDLQIELKAAVDGDYELNCDVNFYWDCPEEPTVAVRVDGRFFEGGRKH